MRILYKNNGTINSTYKMDNNQLNSDSSHNLPSLRDVLVFFPVGYV